MTKVSMLLKALDVATVLLLFSDFLDANNAGRAWSIHDCNRFDSPEASRLWSHVQHVCLYSSP